MSLSYPISSILLLFILLFTSNSFAKHCTYESAIKQAALHKYGQSPYPLKTLSGSTVKMLVFTKYEGYKISDHILNKTIWVTVEGDVKSLCSAWVKKHKQFSHDDLTVWLARLLGLPEKDASKRKFVIMTVPIIQAYYGSPAKNIGIFRPCADPRITEHRDHSDICPKEMQSNDKNISSEFKTWFINFNFISHQKNGLPWTGYGYTYNWNIDTSDHYGVSEFVILENTPVEIIANPYDASSAYFSAEEYCHAI